LKFVDTYMPIFIFYFYFYFFIFYLFFFFLCLKDPPGIFPRIFGHEAIGLVLVTFLSIDYLFFFFFFFFGTFTLLNY